MMTSDHRRLTRRIILVLLMGLVVSTMWWVHAASDHRTASADRPASGVVAGADRTPSASASVSAPRRRHHVTRHHVTTKHPKKRHVVKKRHHKKRHHKRRPATAIRSRTMNFGVTSFLLWRDWDDRDRVFADLSASHTKWLRVDVGWCSLYEQGPLWVSAWYQERLDYVVDQANQRGIKLLLTVGCTPSWAGGTDYGSLPGDPTEYQAAMQYLAARYAGRVNAWEIWNEPDCIGGCGTGSPAAYVPVLQAGFRGVRAGDPRATVVSGGISGNNLDWLRGMYQAGAHGYFDALATHPYIAPTTSGPDRIGGMYSIRSVAAVHQLMAAHGDGSRKIWFTEFGWSTPGTATDRPGVSLITQARYLRASARVMGSYRYVGNAFWYALRDRDDSTPYENHFGLLQVNGSPKPSWRAYENTVQAVNARHRG